MHSGIASHFARCNIGLLAGVLYLSKVTNAIVTAHNVTRTSVMPSTFVNPVVNPDMRLGVAAFDETSPIRHWPSSSADETSAVIRAIYKQILGNAYVMESERQQTPESRFRQGELSVVEFIREVAKSDLYRSRFFENGSRNRLIELNFKHFLGRAPESVAEIAAHSAILDSAGYEADIDSYLDSDEYHQAFGADTVPYYRGYKTGTGTRLVGFTHIFPLLRGASSSDKNSQPTTLRGLIERCCRGGQVQSYRHREPAVA